MKSKDILKRIMKYMKPHMLLFVLQMIFAVVNVTAALYLPILFGYALDHITGENRVDLQGVIQILIEAAIVAVAYGVSGWILTASANRLSYLIVKDMRNDAIANLMRTPIAFIDKAKTGNLTSRIITDADAVGDGLLLGFSQAFTGILTIIVTIVFMFRLDAQIALAVVVMTPLSLVAAAFVAGYSKKYFNEQAKVRGEQNALMDEATGAQKVIQAFGMQQRFVDSFKAYNDDLEKASLKAIFFSSLTNPLTRFVNATVYAIVVLFGAGLVVKGEFSVGELTIFLSYATQYTKPFNEISGVVTELQNAIVCAGRVFEVIDEPPFTDDGKEEVEVDGNVRFDDVSFSYQPDRPLIEGFKLDIRSGMRVAIVGPTGCGKTTLINLIMRFYDVCSGNIVLSGHDVRDIQLGTLRKNVRMVLQDVWIKNGTVRENIAVGKPHATDEEIRGAARMAHADDFIERLPEKYDTRVGEGGVTLSTGEAQLLCISRLMLDVPEILILDEATSSIDTRTEKYIQDSFAYLMQGRTSFVVAHRLSTIKNSDIIIVMRDGHIIEQGDHTSLMQQNGFYRYLYESGK